MSKPRVSIVKTYSDPKYSEIRKSVEKALDLIRVREIFDKSCGIELRDDPENSVYPMPLTASGKYNVEVGRIRKSLVFGEHGLEFFVCGDQLLKGAALNAVQIAECLLEQGKIGVNQ